MGSRVLSIADSSLNYYPLRVIVSIWSLITLGILTDIALILSYGFYRKMNINCLLHIRYV